MYLNKNPTPLRGVGSQFQGQHFLQKQSSCPRRFTKGCWGNLTAGCYYTSGGRGGNEDKSEKKEQCSPVHNFAIFNVFLNYKFQTESPLSLVQCLSGILAFSPKPFAVPVI